jgi:hypothetical protein
MYAVTWLRPLAHAAITEGTWTKMIYKKVAQFKSLFIKGHYTGRLFSSLRTGFTGGCRLCLQRSPCALGKYKRDIVRVLKNKGQACVWVADNTVLCFVCELIYTLVYKHTHIDVLPLILFSSIKIDMSVCLSSEPADRAAQHTQVCQVSVPYPPVGIQNRNNVKFKVFWDVTLYL